MVEKQQSPRGSEFWQIIFPTLIGAGLVLVLGIWFGLTGSSGDISRFAQISTVLLAIPVYIISLLFGFVIVGMIYLVGQLIQGISPTTTKILEILDKIREIAKIGSRSITRLVIEPVAIMSIFRRKPDHQNQEIQLND